MREIMNIALDKIYPGFDEMIKREIRFSFRMYGERWCVHASRYHSHYFILSNWKIGCSVGHECSHTIKAAKEIGEAILKRVGKKEVFKHLKKFEIINVKKRS